MDVKATTGDVRLEPYVPRLVVDWLRNHEDARWRGIEGSLAFVDISGFTALTERLAKRGKVGAEEMSDLLNGMFAELLSVAYRDGAGLVKWGGDAVLLLFEGPDHAARAVRAAYRMRSRLRTVGRMKTPAGLVTLRMSVGIHSGTFHFFLIGDPAVHRELIISGPAASRCAELEALADAGQIAVSAETKALLETSVIGEAKADGWLVAKEPRLADLGVIDRPSTAGLDLAGMLPPPIRQQLRSAVGSAEHRRIAVAFVQFSGTDAVLEADGPAALADALDEAVRNVQEACARHSVTFFESDINRDGGKIMLTAGAPRSSGHDEEAMLRTARRIADRIGRLPLRVGVNCGPVFSGDFGPEFRRTYSVKGDAINLAARVMGKAAPGQVLATVDVLDRATSHFDVEPLAPFMVKGKAKPVNAVSLGRPLGGRADSEATVLFGRERELAVLAQALDAARTGALAVVDLVGEPGIGKSRLVREFVAPLDVPVRLVQCDEYETATPYWPVRLLLGQLLSFPAGADATTQTDLLVAATHRSAPELVEWLPLVAQVMDLAMPETPATAALAERYRKERLEEVTAALLGALLPGPAVVVLDDVHLMDGAAAELFESLLGAVETPAWLMLLTRRDRESGFVPSDKYAVTRLRPSPLGEDQMTHLARDVLGDVVLRPEQLRALTARAEGNPMFLRGMLLAVRNGADPMALPDSVEALITSQIDRLPPDERTVLRYASVLGVAFHERELRGILREQPLPSARSSVARLGYFIRPQGHGRYRFEHQLMRDTAYEGLPYRLRRELHGRAGETLEHYQGDPDDVAELLSMHYFHAGRYDKAWRYSRVAGLRAREKYAYSEADEFLGRAVESGRHIGNVEPLDLAEAQLALGEVRFRTGRNDAAVKAFRGARMTLRDMPERAAAVFKREAESELLLGRTSQALRTLRRGMSLVQGHESKAALESLSRLEGAYAVVREHQGRYRESLRWARQAEEHAKLSNAPEALADALAALAAATSMLGVNDDRDYGLEALDLYEQLGDRINQSRALNNLAVQEWIRGRGIESLEMFWRAQQLAAECGDTVGAVNTKYNVADVLVRMGRVEEATELLREVLPILRAVGIEDFHAAAQRALGLATVLAGDAAAGWALLEHARAVFVQLREAAEVLETEAAMALALLLAEEPVRAGVLAAEGAMRADELDAGYLLPWLLRLQGAAEADMGHLDEARKTLLRALDIADAQSRIERGFIFAELARVERGVGQPELAAEYEYAGRIAFDLLGFVGSLRYPLPSAELPPKVAF